MSTQSQIRIARVYDAPTPADGARLLVDRLWPRGLSKSRLHYDAWLPDVAPSTRLRKWFGHDPKKWDGFRERYVDELAAGSDDLWRCMEWTRHGSVTLLYAAADRDRNNAVVLRDYLSQLPGQAERPRKDSE
ncbi:MAG: DUF488 domain-containing protein [Rhodobiaceae bacterium]|nr:DUF488 domain-containing protein [Rhodobiaceae bacterium]